MDAFNEALMISFLTVLYLETLRKLEADFRSNSHCGVWKGCVGYIDGVHLKVKAAFLPRTDAIS